jgi:Ca2+-binding RTX toxin-like protein
MVKFVGNNGISEFFVGTNGADVFIPGSSELSMPDIVDGGAGTDLLRLDFSGELGGIITDIDPIGAGTLGFKNISFTNIIVAKDIERFHITGTNFSDDIKGGILYDVLRGGNGNDSIQGLGGDDIIYGEDGFDRLNGGAGSDTLYGGAGNDILNGGIGLDTLVGGLGNDIYIVDRRSDVIVELPNEGRDRIKSSVNYSLADFSVNVESLELIEGSGAVEAFGDDLDNNIDGNSNNNRLNGGRGVDILRGKGGNDFLIGGAGNTRDLLYGEDGDDILQGGGDYLSGGVGRDSFRYVSISDLGIDTIVDFDTASDTIEISRAGYGLLGALRGVLDSNSFVLGSSTVNAGATVLYDSPQGLVILDINGKDAGGQIKLANVGSGISLTNQNFVFL